MNKKKEILRLKVFYLQWMMYDCFLFFLHMKIVKLTLKKINPLQKLEVEQKCTAFFLWPLGVFSFPKYIYKNQNSIERTRLFFCLHYFLMPTRKKNRLYFY